MCCNEQAIEVENIRGQKMHYPVKSHIFENLTAKLYVLEPVIQLAGSYINDNNIQQPWKPSAFLILKFKGNLC